VSGALLFFVKSNFQIDKSKRLHFLVVVFWYGFGRNFFVCQKSLFSDKVNLPLKNKKPSMSLKDDFRERITSYILAAFGFVAGLAWNEAIQALVNAFFPLSKDAVWVKLLYAVIVTLIVVVVSAILIKWSGKKK